MCSHADPLIAVVVVMSFLLALLLLFLMVSRQQHKVCMGLARSVANHNSLVCTLCFPVLRMHQIRINLPLLADAPPCLHGCTAFLYCLQLMLEAVLPKSIIQQMAAEGDVFRGDGALVDNAYMETGVWWFAALGLGSAPEECG